MTRTSFHIIHPAPALPAYSYVFETHAISLIHTLQQPCHRPTKTGYYLCVSFFLYKFAAIKKGGPVA